MLTGRRKRDEAEALLRTILDIDPSHAAAANDLGFHLADQGRNLDEAERLVRSAIASDRIDRLKAGNAETENAAYIDSLGWVLFRRGKLSEARTELERASQLHMGASTRSSGTIWAMYSSGSVRRRRGRPPGRRRENSTTTNRAAPRGRAATDGPRS